MSEAATGTAQKPKLDTRFLVGVGAVVVLFAVTFWRTASRMVGVWEKSGSYYSHGWLILPVSAFLVYMQWNRLRSCRIEPSRWGLLFLLPGLALHLVGVVFHVQTFSMFAFLAVLAGLVWGIFGTQIFRLLLFPLAFLVFMVPLPRFLLKMATFRLKLFSTAATTRFLQGLGLAMAREGNHVHIPGGTVVVGEVCSGLKYLISLTAFGALYSYLSSLPKYRKGLLFVLALPIAILANVARVVIMVLIAYGWGVPATEHWYVHDLVGFLLFACAFGMLFVVESMLRGDVDVPGLGLRFSGGESGSASEDSGDAGDGAGTGPGHVPVFAISVLLVTAGLTTYLEWPRSEPPAMEFSLNVPRRLGQWVGEDEPVSETVYSMLGTENVLVRTYQGGPHGDSAMLGIVAVRGGGRRVHPPEECLKGGGYEILTRQVRGVNISTPSGDLVVPVRELILRKQDSRRLAWYFYKAGDDFQSNYWIHEAAVILRRVTRPQTADVLVLLETEVSENDLQVARSSLQDLLSAAIPTIKQQLP